MKSGKKSKKKKKVGKVAGKKKRDNGGFPEIIYLLRRPPSQGGQVATSSLDDINESQLVGVYKLRRPTHVDVKRRLVRNPKPPKGKSDEE